MKRQTIWRVFIALMLLVCSGAMVSCSKDLPDETFVPSKYALIDLHLHLDGSLTVDDAIYMASVDGVTLPSSRSEIEKLLVCPDDCENLNDYLKCFDLPVSIMQSKALEGVTKMTQFPLQYFLKAGVPVCINTDNMSVSNTTVAKELGRLHDAGVMSAADAKTMVRTAIKHAYLSDTEKTELLKKAEEKMK